MGETLTEQFQRVLARLLRPIARAMIANGVTLNAAVESLKMALVDAAEESSEKRLSDSRISLLTGLHRKDARRLRKDRPRPDRRPALNACALAIATWTTSVKFRDEEGVPTVLGRQGGDGKPGFDDLIRSARIDLPAATVLAALEAQGSVAIDPEDNTITLLQDAFVGNPGSEAMLNAYEKNIVAHLSAATDNLLASDAPAPHFERAAHFNQLSDASIEALTAKAGEDGMELLQAFNGRALALQDEDSKGGNATGRFSIGVYVFSRPDDDANDRDDGA